MFDRRLVVFLFISGAAFAQWTPQVSIKVKTVTSAVPSADGRLAVWTETHAVMDGEKSETLTQVYLAHTDGTDRMQLTRGEKSSNAPAFSPDAAWVFFASERNGKRNLYRIPVDGGEAEQITNWSGTLGAYSLSPNGKWIAFTGREADGDVERAKREKRDFRVLDENPANQSLWIVPVEPDASGKRAVKQAAAGPYHIGQFDWSPDSQRIAYEARPTPDADDGRKSDIFEVALETGQIRPVAATSATEAEPRYSPDGRYLAFVRTAQSANRIDGSRIVLLTLNDLKLR
jgi:Tol biopolymer transport system component